MGRIVIIGGGISGLSLAYLLYKQKPSLDLIVLESEKRLGGKIWTDKADGFLCESGVNGFLDNKPKTLELIYDLSLKPLRSNDSARKRLIFSDGRLHLIPESPPAFFTSDLLSLRGRLRVIYEVFIPKGRMDDESLADFARRRLGREAFEKLIDPMASGIYAGDPEKLSLNSCFPRIRELEMSYGSLIRALIRLQIKAKKEGKASPGPGPGGVLTSFYNGMGTLIMSLKDTLGPMVRTDSKVESIDKKGNGYTLYLSNGMTVESDIVVLATPAYAASGMLKDFDSAISVILDKIPYPSVSVVCMGYRKDKIKHNLYGFGFLVPFKESCKVLGTLWDSSIFPNRAPEGYVLLRSMVGGARASDMAVQAEERLVNIVEDELRKIMDIKDQPDFISIYTHEKAIPQYTIGHQERLKAIGDLMVKYKGLYVTGNAYRGISVNDCIENSYRLASRITAETNI